MRPAGQTFNPGFGIGNITVPAIPVPLDLSGLPVGFTPAQQTAVQNYAQTYCATQLTSMQTQNAAQLTDLQTKVRMWQIGTAVGGVAALGMLALYLTKR